MEKMSKELEQQILSALEKTADLIVAGSHPNDAILKVAEENRFSPQIVQRMVEAVNTSRTLAHFKMAQGSVRADTFPVADSAAILEKMYPPTVQTEGQKAAAVWVPPELQRRESTNFMRKSALSVPMPARPSIPTYSGDIEDRQRKAFARREGLRKAADSARSAYRQEFYKLLDMVKTAADYFRRLEHEPFARVEAKLISEYGPLSQKIASMIYEAGNLAKRNEKRAEVDKPVQMVFDRAREPYKTLAAAMDQAELMYKKAEMAIEAEDILSEFEKTAGLSPPKEQLVLEEVLSGEPVRPFAKRSFDLEDTLLSGGTTALGLKDPEGRGAKIEAISEVMNPQHEAQMQSVKVQAMLNDFLSNDPIISSYPSNDVIGAFNQLSQLSPTVAQQPAVMRGMLRKVLQQEGVMEPFEAHQMTQIEKTLKGMPRETEIDSLAGGGGGKSQG